MGLHNRVPELGQALLHKLHTSTQAVLLQEARVGLCSPWPEAVRPSSSTRDREPQLNSRKLLRSSREDQEAGGVLRFPGVHVT